MPLGGLPNGRHVVHVALSSVSNETAGEAADKGLVYEELLTPWAETEFQVSNEAAAHAYARYRRRGVGVAGFMHVTSVGGWRTVLADMQQRLHANTELLDLTGSIEVSIGGPEASSLDELRQIILADPALAPKVALVDTSPADGSMQELPTLQRIRAFCLDHPDDLVWYVHSKGVTHTTAHMRSRVGDWRRFLLHAIFDRWFLCVLALEESGCDACGVNLNGRHTRSTALEALEGPRFGGNFWWARCSWIRQLRAPYAPFLASDPAAWGRAVPGGSLGISEHAPAESCEGGVGGGERRVGEAEGGELGGRLSGEEAKKARKAESELWLGSADEFRPKDLWSSELDHYAHDYPPSAYEGALRYGVARLQCAAI